MVGDLVALFILSGMAMFMGVLIGKALATLSAEMNKRDNKHE